MNGFIMSIDWILCRFDFHFYSTLPLLPLLFDQWVVLDGYFQLVIRFKKKLKIRRTTESRKLVICFVLFLTFIISC